MDTRYPTSDGTIECLDLIKAINLFINSLLFNKGESNWITLERILNIDAIKGIDLMTTRLEKKKI